jgi:glycosyltransferase involved in cell wall biosynthesis
LKHLLVTQNFHPEGGGMSRRYTELVRAYGDPMDVSTLAHPGYAATTSFLGNAVYRQPFALDTSKRAISQARWARWLVPKARSVDVLHCGEIRPVGYAVAWAHIRTRVPYMLYVNGEDLLREQVRTSRSIAKRVSGKYLLENASGVVANSAWTASLARDLMATLSIKSPPAVAEIDLGTDPDQFHPSRDTGRLRSRWDVGSAPLMITVARLVPHKGQDLGIEAFARLRAEFPDLHYVMVGTGHDESRLKTLAAQQGVLDRVIFAGALSDEELAEAYATATVYVGFSRIDSGIDAEGFGIAFVEASASGIPVVAGDSGGVRSAVRNGETGSLVPPTDVSAMVREISVFLRSPELRERFGRAGRQAVEAHYNWDRVGRETRAFVNSCIHPT